MSSHALPVVGQIPFPLWRLRHAVHQHCTGLGSDAVLVVVPVCLAGAVSSGESSVRCCEGLTGRRTPQVVWQTDTSAEAAKARAEEQLSAAMSSMVTVGNLEAEEAEARKREEKRRAKEEAARLVRVHPTSAPGATAAALWVHLLFLGGNA